MLFVDFFILNLLVMRKLLFAAFFACLVTQANSQNLTVEGTVPNLYVTHTVAPKENFYSVGRLYNQSPKVIASFNSITMEKGLTIGQQVKIPLNEQNFDVSGAVAAGETLIPVTHIVLKSETITKIGADYKVTPKLVKQWNSLSTDNITPGAPLIVGHLKVKSGDQAFNTAKPAATVSNEAPVAKNADVNTAAEATPASNATEPVKQKSQPKKEEALAAATKKDTALSIAPQNEPAVVPAVKEAPAKEKPVDAPVAKAERTPQRNVASENTNVAGMETGSMVSGAFSGLFSNNPAQKSQKNRSGEAATFKSTSGWQDKKYYVLMDDVAPGTILKISSGGKVVYAKVLGNMPEMKENTGLLLRISNSAASSLGIIDPKFPVEVSYYQ